MQRGMPVHPAAHVQPADELYTVVCPVTHGVMAATGQGVHVGKEQPEEVV